MVIKNVDCMCRVCEEAGKLYLAKVWFQAWIRSNEANSRQHMFNKSNNQLASLDFLDWRLWPNSNSRGRGFNKLLSNGAILWGQKCYTLSHSQNELWSDFQKSPQSVIFWIVKPKIWLFTLHSPRRHIYPTAKLDWLPQTPFREKTQRAVRKKVHERLWVISWAFFQLLLCIHHPANTIENTLWGKVLQMQLVWFQIYFQDTFENTH